MAARVHHSALCVVDLDRSLRFYRDGLGLSVLMDEEFTGDWPALFGAVGKRLRSVFLGDPAAADAGVVELVQFLDDGAGDPAPPATSPPASGFFLLSLYVDVEAVLGRLDDLGFGPGRRIDQPAPVGSVTMATVHDPDGVLIELIGLPPG